MKSQPVVDSTADVYCPIPVTFAGQKDAELVDRILKGTDALTYPRVGQVVSPLATEFTRYFGTGEIRSLLCRHLPSWAAVVMHAWAICPRRDRPTHTRTRQYVLHCQTCERHRKAALVLMQLGQLDIRWFKTLLSDHKGDPP